MTKSQSIKNMKCAITVPNTAQQGWAPAHTCNSTARGRFQFYKPKVLAETVMSKEVGQGRGPLSIHIPLKSWNIGWSVQFSRSVMSNSLQSYELQHPRPPLSITNSQSLLKLMSIESVMPSNHLILCRPLLLLPSIFPSIKVFSNESVLPIRWPKYCNFSFSISPSNEYSGLISFRMDWLDLLVVLGTRKSLLQHHSSKASILQHSAFFIVQFLHPYMTIGKTIALTRWTFVDEVMSLLFNMLSKLVIAFLPRSKHL